MLQIPLPNENDTSVVQVPCTLTQPVTSMLKIEPDLNTGMYSDANTNGSDMVGHGSDLNNLQGTQWETKQVSDLSMFDIHRAVNAFITGPWSSTQQGNGLCVKKEPEDDLGDELLSQTITNHVTGGGSLQTHTFSGIRTVYGDLTQVATLKSCLGDRPMQSNVGIVVPAKDNAVHHPSTSMCNQFGSKFLPQPKLKPVHYDCPIKECNTKLPTKYLLDKHVMANHKEEGHRCMKCGRRFCRLIYLEQHDNVHKGLKPYKCKSCGKSFHSQSAMGDHYKMQHIESVNKLQCEICGVVIKSSSQMSKHRKQVHLKLRYQCKECDQNFRLVRYLKDHMRMHGGQDPYKCDLCGKTFVQKLSVLKHLKLHKISHQCPKCDKAFKSKDYLKYHLLQHEGIKKFCCNDCGKTFSHAHYLFAHKLSHGEKRFECDICKGKFIRKDNLKAHIIRHQKTGKVSFKKQQ